MVGADYSQTRCVGGDGGTTVETDGLDRIIEFGEDSVRAQAGVRLATLVQALAERGQELALTPEMGNISLGACAVTTLPQASYQAGMAQMSSLVSEIRMITPQGKDMTVTERDRDLLRVLKSSYGLLGIVYEVVLRVRPLTAVKIDYSVLTLKEFGARYASLLGAPGALRLHISPFHDRITVEQRTLDDQAALSRSGIWQIRQSVMRNVLPAFGSTVGSVLAAPGLRAAVLSGMHRALRGNTRGVAMYAHEWMREMPKEAWKSRHTYSMWAFPQADYPRVLAEYFAFSKTYFKQNRYRCNVVTGCQPAAPGQGVAVQRELRRSDVHPRTVLGGGQRLGRLPDRLQRFRVHPWGGADLQPDARAATRARAQGLRRARQAVPRAAPAHRSGEPAAQQLFRLPAGISASPP